ncbi:Mso1p KNAG_0D00190 [Huiozyma naganishii CBS 8797]|uniref:Mso1 N-terminal domain-containing protein n=1 Tax=Huiozyma naganishii (strain ATCC MYA-139 / BCRC 22969 / CBS 8797 / KCTC 17520 / NBRC 10181 / NCYC 3082 / Yp74L-3) TaxID=1071383 RepID=J7S6H8_HUIN7|nr:hypothetical protein KNAG_0D00190 [Kazachstania naganishii CBS 8797]CCK69771.1 hypothetical protein KNAG_0D00190 [Kazachstania naganishii CBS 8797]
MSHVGVQEHGIWNKFRASTKSLSSSFSQLSTKSERDGDTPSTTIVHKAIVKFYEQQEPFQGFPGWLGHKEDLPDEQKVLRKQTEHLAKQAKPSKLRSLRRAATDITHSHSDSPSTNNTSSNGFQFGSSGISDGRRPTAGMSFHSIYKKDDQFGLDINDSGFSSQPDSYRGSPGIPENSGANNSSPSAGSGNSIPTKPASSSDLMSARLKRRATRERF